MFLLYVPFKSPRLSMLFLDFETRSRCDLKAAGVYNYAQDPSTDVLCMSWAFDDEDVQTWTPDQPFPESVRDHKGMIYAHNAAFERLIFWYVLQINFDLTQFYCTATVNVLASATVKTVYGPSVKFQSR